jgi:chromosome segregation ATPase
VLQTQSQIEQLQGELKFAKESIVAEQNQRLESENQQKQKLVQLEQEITTLSNDNEKILQELEEERLATMEKDEKLEKFGKVIEEKNQQEVELREQIRHDTEEKDKLKKSIAGQVDQARQEAAATQQEVVDALTEEKQKLEMMLNDPLKFRMEQAERRIAQARATADKNNNMSGSLRPNALAIGFKEIIQQYLNDNFKLEEELSELRNAYFHSLAVSTKINMASSGIHSNIDIQSLLEKALLEKVSFKEWPKWVGMQLLQKR